MIEKKLHYCWFGNDAKPPLVNKCITTWQKHMPDFELREWNESNFDICVNDFVRGAYEDKNFAFVSDYARAVALYTCGGIYLDTDVEVLKSLKPFLNARFFAGFEEGGFVGTCVMGAQKQLQLFEAYIEHYDQAAYRLPDGTKYKNTNVVLMTQLLEQRGFRRGDDYQEREGLLLFPRTYFSPYDYINGAQYFSENSYAVHHFAQSWLPKSVRAKTKLKRAVAGIVRPKGVALLRGRR